MNQGKPNDYEAAWGEDLGDGPLSNAVRMAGQAAEGDSEYVKAHRALDRQESGDPDDEDDPTEAVDAAADDAEGTGEKVNEEDAADEDGSDEESKAEK